MCFESYTLFYLNIDPSLNVQISTTKNGPSNKMLFELLRITCQISLRLYISTFRGQLSHLHLDQKVRKFSKDQKVFKKTNRSSKSGFVFCGVLNLFSLNLTDEVHLTRYQISLLSVQNKRSMKMLYKNNVFWSVFIFRKKTRYSQALPAAPCCYQYFLLLIDPIIQKHCFSLIVGR